MSARAKLYEPIRHKLFKTFTRMYCTIAIASREFELRMRMHVRS